MLRTCNWRQARYRLCLRRQNFDRFHGGFSVMGCQKSRFFEQFRVRLRAHDVLESEETEYRVRDAGDKPGVSCVYKVGVLVRYN